MLQHSEFLGFLQNLDEEDIEVIQNDCGLYFKGIKTFYIVDTFDIINYTLPFIESNLKNKDLSKFSQHTVAYEVVFSNKERFNISLPDEYKHELNSIKNNLDFKLRNFPKIKDKFLNLLIAQASLDSNDKSFVLKHIDAFTTFYIFHSHGKNIYKRFNEFLSSYINVKSFASHDKKINDLVNTCFAKIRQSNLVEKVFDKFVDDSIPKLLSFETDFERHCYLQNTYNDIAVIGRLFKVNENLSPNNIRFLYLSSVPHKTDKIISLFIKGTHSKEKGFHRSIMQLYLYNYILDNVSNIDEAKLYIDSLIQFKRLDRSRIDLGLDSKNSNIIQIISGLVRSFEKQKNEFESGFFYKSYFKYRDEFEKLIDSKSIPEDVLSDIKKFNSYIDKEDYLNLGIRNSIDIVENLRITYALEEKVTNLKGEIFITLGNDIVKNSFHHLPYLLLLNSDNENIDKIRSIFYSLVDDITNNTSIIGIKSENYKKHFIRLFRAIEKKSAKSINYISIRNVLLTFLNTITHNEQDIDISSEEEIIENLIRYKSVADYSSGRPKIVKKMVKRG